MTSNAIRELALESLADGIPTIPDDAVGYYKQKCMVCFHNQGHESGVWLVVEYRNSNEIIKVCWSGEVTDEILRAWADLRQATFDAASAMALLLVREFTEFTAIRQAAIGTTVDYYLARQEPVDDLIFNDVSRLEVSGILQENEGNTVESRVREKLRRLEPERDLPALIVVVEFSQPWSKMVEAHE